MMTGAAERVVLAVGPDPIESALRYAVDEARRSGRGLHLLHVVPDVSPGGPETVLMEQVDLETLGRETLDTVSELAADLAGDDVPVTSELRQGHVVPTLVHALTGAALVVLEHRPRGRWERIVTRSVTGGVAARTEVPVVSVPAGWRPESRDRPAVTVGVDDPERAHAVLVSAFDLARARGASLRILRTWDLPVAYDDLITIPEHDRWVASTTAAVAGALAGLGERGKGVPVQIDVRRGRAADCLVEAGRASDLLVIGRHDPLLPFGSHLGSIARAVLREATCPVLLVSPHGSEAEVREP